MKDRVFSQIFFPLLKMEEWDLYDVRVRNGHKISKYAIDRVESVNKNMESTERNWLVMNENPTNIPTSNE